MSQRIELAEAKLEDLPEVQRLAEVTWKACYPGIISEGQIRYMLDRGYQLDVLQKDIEEHNIRFVLARTITKLWVLERMVHLNVIKLNSISYTFTPENNAQESAIV